MADPKLLTRRSSYWKSGAGEGLSEKTLGTRLVRVGVGLAVTFASSWELSTSGKKLT